MIKLDAAVIRGFSEAFLKSHFDEPVPTPGFHSEMWEICCDESKPHAVMAAPRDHAKSTAVTHTFTLAAALFGFRDYILVVSDTEGQSTKFLGDIKMELQENELLIKEFGVEKFFVKDTETEIIFKCAAGLINITAKGAEQKVRGLKWRNKRPNLVVVDDLENDELVMNKDRRDKLRTWFLTALLPCGSKRCLYRVVGTVLHLDSLLNRLLEDKTWERRCLMAHTPDFSHILWPSKFSEARLKSIRARFIAQGKSEKYSQEYLNRPLDEEHAFFKREWFLAQSRADESSRKRMFGAVDLAVSTKESADFTCIGVGGQDAAGVVHILDIRRGRWDALETVEQMFEVQELYGLDLFYLEKGPLHKAFLPFLNQEMLRRRVFINLHAIPSTKDKMTRARAIQAQLKAGGIRVPIQAEWVGDLMEEMIRFPRGKNDDQVDVMAFLGQGLDTMGTTDSDDDVEEQEYNIARRQADSTLGRSKVCGY